MWSPPANPSLTPGSAPLEEREGERGHCDRWGPESSSAAAGSCSRSGRRGAAVGARGGVGESQGQHRERDGTAGDVIAAGVGGAGPGGSVASARPRWHVRVQRRAGGGLNFTAAVSLYGACFALRPSQGDDPADGDRRRSGQGEPCLVVHPLPSHPSIHVHVLPGTYDAFDQANFTTIKYDLVGYPMLSSGAATKQA